MRPKDFNVNELIEALQGTCTSIEDHLPENMEFMELTNEDLDTIDNNIFECSCCNWWCEISEATENKHGENICEDCLNEWL